MKDAAGPPAIVPGGDGRQHAAQLGMLEALVATGNTPDLVVGTRESVAAQLGGVT